MALIEKIRERVTRRHIGETVKETVKEAMRNVGRRFPICCGFLAAVTGMIVYHVAATENMSPEEICLLYFLTVGMAIDIAVSLWGEEYKGEENRQKEEENKGEEQGNKGDGNRQKVSRRRRWITEGILLGIWAVYCAGIYVAIEVYKMTPEKAFFTGNTAWICAIVHSIPFVSFRREKDDLKAWHFLLSLCGAVLVSGIVSSIMCGGLNGLYAGTAALFDFKVKEKAVTVIVILCLVLLAGLLFLALVPKGERKHNASGEMPGALRKIVTWLLLPMLGCYIAVLYAYGLSIIIRWELPKGMISWLVSAVMAGYLICYVLLYPETVRQGSRIGKLMTFWMPVLLLPLLVLMTVGVARRLSDYGITPMRLYLLTLLAWFYAVCIVMMVSKKKRFRWTFLSFAGLFLLSSGHPLNYYRLCRSYLTAKIDKTIAEKNLYVPLNLSDLSSEPTLSEEEADALCKDLIYMRTTYGEEYTSRWITRIVPNSENEKAVHEEAWKVRYGKHDSHFAAPEGYSRFVWKNRNSYSNPETISDDSLYDGVLHVRYEEAVLLFDTAAIRHAEEQQETIIIHSADDKGALSLGSATFTGYDDHETEVEFSGYWFTK